ncbi:hypothetical protein CONLIGDRAFT_710124 [Coniochaeta ligniaria NRRL 30616]|uniref:Uncharacterized protein n=1 Tax=Coniochaeta ligniaria NRRL 30616 TaxID=1408157 RepID=A0A1J7J653_9PEZI|nr:hypothetical protein CONLIGDRAFT_710124 [Coniochaeta ligniaria NRRL 30616]
MLIRPCHRPIVASFLPSSLSRCHSTTPTPKSHKITTILTGAGAALNKTHVLAALHDSLSLSRGVRAAGKPFDAALILASRSLTSWLDDPSFVGPLVRMTGQDVTGSSVPPAGGVSVLSAVVEGLGLPSQREEEVSAEGFAVVQGYRDELLPGLWEGREGEGVRARRGDGRAGLVFRVAGLGVKGVEGEEMDVTVPVANTVFQNGRTSTLFAARWAGTTWRNFQAVERVDVGSQVVRVPIEGGEQTGVSVPLVSITPLRTVKSALGNILKKVEIGGEAAPASKELEENVPKLLESRRKMGLGDIQGPLNVWALVVPARLKGMWKAEVLDLLDLQPLLREGCRLHRVLSGGGGWGAKQGLLSLDPEARFETTDEEDVESFERDFLAGQNGGSGGGSVVGPGDEVVFCVDTGTYPKSSALVEQERGPKRFVVKVRPETAEEVPYQRLGDVGMQRLDDFFGVVSTAMFVAPDTARDGEQSGMAASMKIDTPGSELFILGKAAELETEVDTPVPENELQVPPEYGSHESVSDFDEVLRKHELQWANIVKG